jgi:hypothetical protein
MRAVRSVRKGGLGDVAVLVRELSPSMGGRRRILEAGLQSQ